MDWRRIDEAREGANGYTTQARSGHLRRHTGRQAQQADAHAVSLRKDARGLDRLAQMGRCAGLQVADLVFPGHDILGGGS